MYSLRFIGLQPYDWTDSVAGKLKAYDVNLILGFEINLQWDLPPQERVNGVNP